MLGFIKDHLFLFKLLLVVFLLVIIAVEVSYTELATSSDLYNYFSSVQEITVIDSHGPDARVDELTSLYFSVDDKTIEAVVGKNTIINHVGLEEGVIEYDIEYKKDYSSAEIKEIRY